MSATEWTPEKVRGRVAEFLQVIDTKDISKLDRYNNGQFDGFWKLFQWRTGIKVPTTQKGIDLPAWLAAKELLLG